MPLILTELVIPSSSLRMPAAASADDGSLEPPTAKKSHRAAPSHGKRTSAAGGEEAGTDQPEPVFHHAIPSVLAEEILHDFGLAGVLDLMPGDGKFAMASIRKRIPYVGLVFNDAHRVYLQQHLEALVFRAMQNETDELYSPGLASFLANRAATSSGGAQANEAPSQPGAGRGGRGRGGRGRGGIRKKAIDMDIDEGDDHDEDRDDGESDVEVAAEKEDMEGQEEGHGGSDAGDLTGGEPDDFADEDLQTTPAAKKRRGSVKGHTPTSGARGPATPASSSVSDAKAALMDKLRSLTTPGKKGRQGAEEDLEDEAELKSAIKGSGKRKKSAKADVSLPAAPSKSVGKKKTTKGADASSDQKKQKVVRKPKLGKADVATMDDE